MDGVILWRQRMLAERVYSVLPLALQNVAVSLKGWKLHQARYLSRSFRESELELQGNEHLSLEALKELQFREFCFFAKFCYEASPYYRRLWQSRKLHPLDIRRREDMSLAPVVPKMELRAHTEEFFTEKMHWGMEAVHTSGTSGSPLTVYFTSDDVGRRFAFLDRCRRWAGVGVGQKRASFTGRNLIPSRQRTPPFWRYNYPGRQLLFSSYHLSAQNLDAYVDALEDFQPEILDGYPSALHVVAEHMLRKGRTSVARPRAILTSAETVLPHQRRSIESAFAAKLYNQYASSEGAPFVSECWNGQLHVQLDSGVIEILDFQNQPVRPGEVGQIVVTSFFTHMVPLLRYAMGDTAIAGEHECSCPCGLPFPTIQAIVGRVDDFLFTAERGFVGRLDTVFKAVPNSIIEAQIVQTSPDRIVLRLVPDRPKYSPKHAEKIVEEMRARLGRSAVIAVEEVDSIPRSANGKMRPVVNLCKDLLPDPLRYVEQVPVSDASER
jgi:phenylacetate-CoA ligase